MEASPIDALQLIWKNIDRQGVTVQQHGDPGFSCVLDYRDNNTIAAGAQSTDTASRLIACGIRLTGTRYKDSLIHEGTCPSTDTE